MKAVLGKPPLHWLEAKRFLLFSITIVVANPIKTAIVLSLKLDEFNKE